MSKVWHLGHHFQGETRRTLRSAFVRNMEGGEGHDEEKTTYRSVTICTLQQILIQQLCQQLAWILGCHNLNDYLRNQ
jgi:hypothetical protein